VTPSDDIVVNGRFLANRFLGGVHRAGRSYIDSLRLLDVGLEVVAPRPTDDRRVDRQHWVPPGQTGWQIWEQVVLPAHARSRTLLSLANTGPLFASRHVMFLYDVSFHVAPHWFRPHNNRYMEVMLRAARRATRVVVASETVRAELANLGVALDRTVVIPLAVDPMFSAAPEAAIIDIRHRLNLSQPYFVIFGWGDPRKDVATVVAAHTRLVTRQPHDIVLLGRQHPKFAPVSIPTIPSLRPVGHLDDAALPALLSGAAGLLYPSRYEGFGLPPLEAVACGTPALASDIPVLVETVGTAAHLLPPGDVRRWEEAMSAALEGQIAPGVAPSWSWRDAGQRLAALLNEVS
jgi:glycosyltransferase involved in cell wall biosynthesis